MTQSTDELEAFLQEHAGTHLQGVATYDTDGLHWQYTTDEFPHGSFTDNPQLLSELRTAGQHPQCGSAFDVGTFVSSLWCYEDGLVLHFSQTVEEGTIVVLDATTSQKLIRFMKYCRDHLMETADCSPEASE